MANQIGSLFVKLGIDGAEFGRGLGSAEKRAQRFAKVASVAMAAAAVAAAAAITKLTRDGLQAIDANAKLAQSLGTTTTSIAVLNRAADLAGVTMGTVEQGVIALTRRLSEAAGGSGVAVDALDRLHLSAEALQELSVDDRISTIQDAITKFIPEAERAAVASDLFGSRAGVMFARIDSATLDIARADVEAFGLAVSEVDADQIERTNDAISRMGLIGQGLANTFAIALAPALESFANGMATIASNMGPVREAIIFLGENLNRIATYATTAAALFAGKFVAGFVAAAFSVSGLSTALLVLRGALIRTGIGAVIVLAGELVFQFMKLVRASGGFGTALGLLRDAAIEVFTRMAESTNIFELKFQVLVNNVRVAWSGMIKDLSYGWAVFLRSTATAAENIPFLGEQLGKAADAAYAGLVDNVRETNTLIAQTQNLAGQITMSESFADRPMTAVTALGAAISTAGDEAAETSTQIDELSNSVEELETVGGGAGGGGGGGGGGGPLAGVSAAIDTVGTKVKTLSESISETLGSSLQSVFEGLLSGTMTIKQALSTIFTDLAKMAANRLITSLLGSLFGGGVGGGISIPGFASGTNNAPAGVALVGEEGPELVRFSGGEQVVPNNQIGGPMSVTNLNILDPSIVGDYLMSPSGNRVFVNEIKKAQAS